jgi:hypothetical protein
LNYYLGEDALIFVSNKPNLPYKIRYPSKCLQCAWQTILEQRLKTWQRSIHDESSSADSDLEWKIFAFCFLSNKAMLFEKNFFVLSVYLNDILSVLFIVNLCFCFVPFFSVNYCSADETMKWVEEEEDWGELIYFFLWWKLLDGRKN